MSPCSRTSRRALRVVGPDAGEAVGLELLPHRERIAFRVGRPGAARQCTCSREAEQVLHVVPHLVRDHVGLREIAGRLEPLAQLVVEREVDVHLLVSRAVERPHGRLREAARGLHRAREEHQLRLAIVPAELLAEDLVPRVLGVGEHDRDELRGLVRRERCTVACAAAERTVRRPRLLRGCAALQQDGRVDPEVERREHEQDEAEAADPTAPAHPSPRGEAEAAPEPGNPPPRPPGRPAPRRSSTFSLRLPVRERIEHDARRVLQLGQAVLGRCAPSIISAAQTTGGRRSDSGPSSLGSSASVRPELEPFAVVAEHARRREGRLEACSSVAAELCSNGDRRARGQRARIEQIPLALDEELRFAVDPGLDSQRLQAIRRARRSR